VFKPNHLHVLIKGHLNRPPKDEATLNDWFRRLVTKVRMVVVAGPTSVYVNEPGNEGITGTVTLATSHASIHVWDAESPAMFQFDLYSCSCFSVDEVLDHFAEFEITDAEWMYLDRNEGIHVKETGSHTWAAGVQ
jgi:S-adenosylmethionine/arginine decarboxylase-like enzyme